jgi:anion-transporting  ArsA/GET3 family ATPase
MSAAAPPAAGSAGPGARDVGAFFRSRVIFVSGKGGTGKTALSAAIARICAAQGRRTLLVELDAQRPSLGPIFGRAPAFEPVEVTRNLWIANLTWLECLDAWLQDIVQMPRIFRAITKNRVVGLFLEATPGARDLSVMSRVMRLAERHDTVVVDMPASGNAVAMLSIAHTARRLFDTGPIRRNADELVALYARPDTAAVLVGLPEEMVVNETIETARKIRQELAPLRLPFVVLNRSTMPSFSEAESALLDRLLATETSPVAAEVLGAGRWEAELESATAEALRRLDAELGAQVVSLPMVARGEDAGRVVQQLTVALARQTGVRVDLRVGA